MSQLRTNVQNYRLGFISLHTTLRNRQGGWTSSSWVSLFKIAAKEKKCRGPACRPLRVRTGTRTLQGGLDVDIPARSDRFLGCLQGIPQAGIPLDVEKRRNQESAANTWTKDSVKLFSFRDGI